jgi:hypothetical protein
MISELLIVNNDTIKKKRVIYISTLPITISNSYNHKEGNSESNHFLGVLNNVVSIPWSTFTSLLVTPVYRHT